MLYIFGFILSLFIPSSIATGSYPFTTYPEINSNGQNSQYSAWARYQQGIIELNREIRNVSPETYTEIELNEFPHEELQRPRSKKRWSKMLNNPKIVGGLLAIMSGLLGYLIYLLVIRLKKEKLD